MTCPPRNAYNTNEAITREARFLDPIEKARKAVEAASDKQAIDIVMLDVRGMCSFADVFVLCTAESSRQIDAVCDEVEKALSRRGEKLYRREGTSATGWVLLDFSDLIVHVFAPPERAYYGLEELWGKAKTLVRIQ